MRELLIANSIVKVIENEVKNDESYFVDKVTLEIGQVSGINVDALKTSLKAAIKGTKLEHTKFYFQFVSAIAKCDSCNREFETGLFFNSCPFCGSMENHLLSGRELTIKSINMEYKSHKDKHYV